MPVGVLNRLQGDDTSLDYLRFMSRWGDTIQAVQREPPKQEDASGSVGVLGKTCRW
jgi:hypothetical protein